jgi:dTDP-4-amino-4,6-dideoxygalactose transaminase/predicted GNAT family N-acyltransferase
METIQLFKVYMNSEVDKFVVPTLTSGMITQGKKVEELEIKLKEWFNYPYILTLNSATSGLTLAYRLLDLGSDDEVISTPLTCFATNAAILANNLDIVWADTDPNTCNIDLEDVKRKITQYTKALSFVHWGGVPVDLDKVKEIKEYAKEKFNNELHVIEDCAHAFGAEFNGKKLGTHGNICVFSLQAIKHLTTGDGGLIFLPNEEMYKRAKLLRWFGIDRERRSLPGSDFRLEPDIPEYGYKFHMNDINASIGLANFGNIENILQKCRENAKYYNEKLKDINGIKLFTENEKSVPSYWIYTLKIQYNRKLEFIHFMKNKGVVVSQVHARNDKHSCLQLCQYIGKLKQLDRIESEIVSIPVGWWLTKENTKYIVDCIIEFSNEPYLSFLDTSEIGEYSKLMYQLNNYKPENVEQLSLTKQSLKSIYVLKIHDKIVSTAKLLIEEKLYEPMGHIEDVVTDSEFRGKGYGKMLIEILKNLAFEKFKCYKIVLNCKTELEPFYSSCKMEKTGYSFSIYKDKNK